MFSFFVSPHALTAFTFIGKCLPVRHVYVVSI
ncbi:unnamed protein product [Schistosoma mattheei]|uniref:Uncharacterized protein n=1 Tax=Schistosoma mattheei TaxID=31246 RepID=A0A3P8GCX8_9TREM|nr:unnamed protein product [Schistosoma mattheei]